MTIDHSGVRDVSDNGNPIVVQRSATKLSGTFAATGTSDAVFVKGINKIELNFGSGSVTLQRSLDSGATFVDVVLPDGITAAAFTADAAFDYDAGTGSLLRFNCTSHSSDITYKVG